ncbi:MAG TPA: hypothetical protein EYP53_09945 [Candidatus Latescibacteria bacterium]|nr:hypothetical protein [Candidatus Latescibacterota bacterium]
MGTKAIALLSGGLDSTLAIRVVLDQGIEVIALNFLTPFCLCDRRGCRREAIKAADELGVELKVFNIAEEYLGIVKNPRYGYGKNMNPCIDCRIMMHRKAKEYMQMVGASFVITGEVLGQRPMSQHKAALRIIERDSGLEGLVLRPLSAKLLPPTIPEEQGLIDRERLLAISGRSRKPQMALATRYGINDYPSPAGGCLLTDPGFARRMKDLLDHTEVTLGEIGLLRMGRHFRLSPSAKLVVGRDKEENERLLRLSRTGDVQLTPTACKGPIAIGRGHFDQDLIMRAARIVARYSDTPSDAEVAIGYRRPPDDTMCILLARPLDEEELEGLRI